MQNQQHLELTDLAYPITEFCQRVNHGLKQATFEQKRRLVELLIDQVVVTNEEVEIRYVIPISSESEQIRFCHLLTDYSGSRMYPLLDCSSGEEEREACSSWSPKRFTTLER